MITSGSITLYGQQDPTYARMILSSSVIAVNSFNEQDTPLVIRVVQVEGDDETPLSVNIRLYAKSLDKKVAGTDRDFGMVSQATFTIPASDLKYAAVTTIVVEAYADTSASKLLTSSTVNVVCSDMAQPYYRGSSWKSTDQFRNGEYLDHTVNGQTSIYQWVSRVTGNTSKAPWSITSTTDLEYGFWKHLSKMDMLITQLFIAFGGLIGSASFFGDYMISQQGIAKTAGATYQDFDEDMTKFIPNIMLNFMRGTGHFGHGNIKIDEDGRMTFFSESTGGCIVINPSNRTLQFLNSKGKAVVEFGFNAEREGVNTESYIKLLNKTQGELKLYSDGCLTGKSEGGEVYHITPTYGLEFVDGLRYSPRGVVLNVYRAEDWSETNLLSARPDMVIFKANVTNMLLPTANAANRGRRIRMKNFQANVDFKSSTNNLYAASSMNPTNSVHVDAATTYEWWCDGANWYMAFCK